MKSLFFFAVAAIACVAVLSGVSRPWAQTFTPAGIKERPGTVTPDAPKAPPKPTEAKDFKDWRMECFRIGQKDRCTLFQRKVVKIKDKQIPVLLGVLSQVGTEKKQTVTRLKLVTPVNVWLPAGVSLKLDGGKEIKAPYLRCGMEGCMTDLGLADDFLPAFKKAGKMSVTYVLGNRHPTTIDLSMSGVTAGLAALETRK